MPSDEESDEESVPLSDLRDDVADRKDQGDRDGEVDRQAGRSEDSGEAMDPKADWQATDTEAAEETADPQDREAEDVEGDREPKGPDDEPIGGAGDDSAAPGDPVPLSDLKDDLAGREGGETNETLFQRESVDDVESEAVWAELLMGEADTTEAFDPTSVEEAEGRDYQIVPTTLCHRCEFFGDPPELHCTHEGTTIHETVDMEHYRVSACPMVKTDREPDRAE